MSESKPKNGDFCWHELMTSSPSTVKEFYKEMFDWETTDIDMGETTYHMFRSGDKEIAGMMKIPEEQSHMIPPHWMSYVHVDDLDAMLEKAEKLGASIKVPAKDVPGYGRFGVIADPTGAYISFWQPV